MRKLTALLIFASTAFAADLPLVFERNAGQAADDVRFLSRAGRQSVALLDGGSFRIQDVDIHLAGADPHASISAVHPLPGRSNYFGGADPRHWLTDIEQFAQVRYHDVYPGVDLAFHGREYDFIAAPHSDPSRIRLEFPGAHPRLDRGDLTVAAFRQQRPHAYQVVDGHRRDVAASFVLSGNTARFRLGPYDHSAPLVIDPVIVFATYLGGSNKDVGDSIAVDAAGNIYVAGSTQSADFPATNLLNSGGAFVTKLSPDGSTILYSSVIGNSNSSATGVVVDANGNAYVTGLTSGTFPATTGAYQSASPSGFIAKLNPAGNQLLYSALIAAQPNAIAIDATGAAYVTGSADPSFVATPGAFQTTSSPGNCPQVNLHQPAPPCTNAFVLKLKPDASAPAYATFLGGTGPDSGAAIAIDSAGNAAISGATASANFPVTANAIQSTFHGGPATVGPNVYGDAFVAKLDPAGSSLIFSTYLGGAGSDYGTSVAIDSAGNIYASGVTASTDFPASTTLGPGSFVTKLAPAGTLVYSTQVYSSASMAVDQAGFVYLESAGPPSTIPYLKPAIAILNPAGNGLVSSGGTGVGSSGSSPMVLDGKGFAYQTGQVGPGAFFATPGSVQPTYTGGAYTAFAIKLALSDTPRMSVATVVNAANQWPGLLSVVPLGAVAPGEIVTIYGWLLGPDTGVAAPAGNVPATLSGTRVLFDNTPAPLLWVQSSQINAVVPFEVKAPTTAMTIEYGGKTYGPITLPVATTVPGIFTLDGTGNGQAAVLNQDGSPNSPANPAARGTIISIFAGGAGSMNVPATDGALTPSTWPLPMPLLDVQVLIGGVPARLQYAGAAPALVAGALQVNAYVPDSAPSGDSISILLNVGGYLSYWPFTTTTPGRSTIAIR